MLEACKKNGIHVTVRFTNILFSSVLQSIINSVLQSIIKSVTDHQHRLAHAIIMSFGGLELCLGTN